MSVIERRQTPTERLHEVTMAVLQRRPQDPEHMVEISRNARGIFQFTVTVRGDDVNTCWTRALDVATLAAEQYPYPETPDAA